jgi:hypothetical protein
MRATILAPFSFWFVINFHLYTLVYIDMTEYITRFTSCDGPANSSIPPVTCRGSPTSKKTSLW